VKEPIMHEHLFSPLSLGAIRLPTRIIMAPLTRMRAGPGGVPTALNALYYAQRVSAALIIAEGTCISRQAQGYPGAPGIFTPEQIAGWRRITDEIHARGGRIAMQIAHNGRNSLFDYAGATPVAPSAITYIGKVYDPSFHPLDPLAPRALETAEIAELVESFRQAAANARGAGFDMVEIQGANGHLIDQFLQDGSNQRTDRYGGEIANRVRFLMEIVDAVAQSIGADRLGVRISPYGRYGGISETDTVGLFTHVAKELSRRKIAYLHVIEARGSEMGVTDVLHADAANTAALFRPHFDGPFLSAAAYTPDSADAAVASGSVDAVAFGRMFIANPDLVERIRSGSPLNTFDRTTSYGGGEHGYTDYRTLQETAA
jgi:N-ethylmaleimide reductase